MHRLKRGLCVFNFFSELKKQVKDKNFFGGYNIINLSSKLLYIEGHLGLSFISTEKISLKVKNGRVVIEGKDLCLCELTANTLKISGKISKVEVL